MGKALKIGMFVLVIVCSGSIVFASQTVVDAPASSFSFVNYVNVGGGAAFIQEENPVLLDLSYGFELAPWFSLGTFIAVNPLSSFAHADMGVSIANTEAAFALMSGMELLFTPASERMIHPILRMAVGGVSVGHLKDIDGNEGYDVVSASRSTFASLSAGLELNITNCVRLALRGGWRFAGHGETMGIDKYGLSGPEVSLSLRTVWRTEISKR